MFCGTANDIGVTDIQPVDVLDKSICIKLRNLHNALMAFLCSFKHFVFAVICIACKVSDIGDVHYVLYFVTEKSKSSVKNIKKNIRTKVSDMCIIVNCRTAAVKTDKTFFYWLKFLQGFSHRVE